MSETTYQRFTREQLTSINRISITGYMKSKGYELTPLSKNEFKIKGYGGLVLSEIENVWYCFTASKGGGLVQLLMFLENKSWKEAVTEILGCPQEGIVSYDRTRSEKSEMPLELPEKSSNARNVIAYLCSTRRLDYDIVIWCLKEKLIYQDKRKNCVFVGYDNNGRVKHVHLKGTNPDRTFIKDIEDSDKRFAFSIIGETNTVFVFESPVDLLSYMSLKINIGLDVDDSYISLYGTSNLRLIQFLEDYPDTKEIVLCLDNDAAGIKATQEITEELKVKFENKYEIKVDKSELKDFNDSLIYSLRAKKDVDKKKET